MSSASSALKRLGIDVAPPHPPSEQHVVLINRDLKGAGGEARGAGTERVYFTAPLQVDASTDLHLAE